MSQQASQHVTVALSGDGGDELFGGYNRYTFAPILWDIAAKFPAFARKLAGRSATLFGPAIAGKSNSFFRTALHFGLPPTTIDKLSLVGRAISEARNFEDFYSSLVSTFASPLSILINQELDNHPAKLQSASKALSPVEMMMLMDALKYLPGDILVKVDRAAMYSSLEVRAPLLDRRIVELAWSLPLTTKVHGRTGKRVLRTILDRYVPTELINRPKQGFAIPLDEWLRHGLRDWAEDLLSPSKLQTTGVFKSSAIRRLWLSHQSRSENAGARIWAVLMLQFWLLSLPQLTSVNKPSSLQKLNVSA